MTREQYNNLKAGDIISITIGTDMEIDIILKRDNYTTFYLFCLYGSHKTFGRVGEYDICSLAESRWELITNGR